jgi:hypothetical protein
MKHREGLPPPQAVSHKPRFSLSELRVTYNFGHVSTSASSDVSFEQHAHRAAQRPRHKVTIAQRLTSDTVTPHMARMKAAITAQRFVRAVRELSNARLLWRSVGNAY